MVFVVLPHHSYYRYFYPLTTVVMWLGATKNRTFNAEKPPFWAVFLKKHGPSDRIRTCGILLPNLSGILFPLVYSGFRRFLICFTYSLTLLSPLFPGVPVPSVVIYVVKNASRPVSDEDSPMPSGKRFAFQIVCIVTLRRGLCRWFLRGWRLSSCGAIDKEYHHAFAL